MAVFVSDSVSRSILVFFSFAVLSIRSETCNFVTHFLTNNGLYTLNATDSVMFLPTDYSYIKAEWENSCPTGNCTTANEILYGNERITSLSKTDLQIKDEELTNAIYNSLVGNTLLNDVIIVFPNRYVVRTNSEKMIIFSIKIGFDVSIVSPKCDTNAFQYKSTLSKIKGLVCVSRFSSSDGRNKIKCDNITLFLIPIVENGKLDGETKCDNRRKDNVQVAKHSAANKLKYV